MKISLSKRATAHLEDVSSICIHRNELCYSATLQYSIVHFAGFDFDHFCARLREVRDSLQTNKTKSAAHMPVTAFPTWEATGYKANFKRTNK